MIILSHWVKRTHGLAIGAAMEPAATAAALAAIISWLAALRMRPMPSSNVVMVPLTAPLPAGSLSRARSGR